MLTCTKCDAQFAKWQGRCSECGAWGTIKEQTGSAKKINLNKAKPAATVSLAQIVINENSRLKTKINELDRVLGGGIVAGSLILLGGDPGVGKSTLALQIAERISKIMYVSGEESTQQIKLRCERIGVKNNISFLPETEMETIAATIEAQKPSLVIIDSIQTLRFSDFTGAPGSVSQITGCTGFLMEIAKKQNTAIIIIGHVTKDGFVAGPKTLEHLVDVVLYLENDAHNYYKILRTSKNRFGSTGEIGIFEMAANGLKEIVDPSGVFLEKNLDKKPGVTVSAVMEGSRPFLVEIQALACKTTFGYPQRRAMGIDLNRLQMLIAVISKNSKINLSNQDIYLNVAGGLKIKETATDLAAVLAIISAYLEISISSDTLILGEIGLSGEVRPVPNLGARIKEAEKMGFKKMIIPKTKENIRLAQCVTDLSQAIAQLNIKK